MSVCRGFCLDRSVNINSLCLVFTNRTDVSELQEVVRHLRHREHEQAPLPSAHTSGKSPPGFLTRPCSTLTLLNVVLLGSEASPRLHNHSRGIRVEKPDSDSEDFSPTPSLAEVSSDDLSWLEDKEPGKSE